MYVAFDEIVYISKGYVVTWLYCHKVCGVYRRIFQVVVEDLKTRDSVEFPCERWFSTSKDDGQITRELTRADSKDKGNEKSEN